MSNTFDPYHKWLGIPPEEQPPTHYRLLGITPLESDRDVIDAAANRQMTFLQECGSGPNMADSQRLLNEVAAARVTLLNPTKKSAYDETLRKKLAKAKLNAQQAEPKKPPKPPPVSAAVPPRIPPVASPGGFPQIETRRRSKKAASQQTILAVVAVVVLVIAAAGYLIAGKGNVPISQTAGVPNATVPNPPSSNNPDTAKKPLLTRSVSEAPPTTLTRSVSEDPRPTPQPDPPDPQPPTTDPPVKEPPPKGTPELSPRPNPDPDLPPDVVAAAETNPKSTDPKSTDPKPVAPTAVDSRAAIPDKDVQAAATKLIRPLFKDGFASKKLEERAALAKKLLQQGIDTPDDLGVRYVLFREARDVAVGVGDVETALSAAECVSKHFSVIAFEERLEVLTGLSAKVRPPEGANKVADAAVKLMDEAVAADEYDVARRAVTLASAAAKKAQNVTLVTQLPSRQRDIEQMKKDFEAVKTALETLKTSPDDPDANLAAGKFLCFIKGDFEKGLPLLAKGTDPRLSDLAKQDLQEPEKPEDQLALADKWWFLGEKERDPAKSNLLFHASVWYSQVVLELKGLVRTQVEAKLREVQRGQPLPGRNRIVNSLVTSHWKVTWSDGSSQIMRFNRDGTWTRMNNNVESRGRWQLSGELAVIEFEYLGLPFLQHVRVDNGMQAELYQLPAKTLIVRGVCRPITP